MLYMCGTLMPRWPVGDMKHMLVSAVVTADRMDVGQHFACHKDSENYSETGF